MQSGIYTIVANNMYIYIGQSTDISKRIKRHKYYLCHCKHFNPILNNIAKKYGLDVFRFDTIEYCKPDILDAQEQYWINYFRKENKYQVTNIGDGGNVARGWHQNNEVKNRISKHNRYYYSVDSNRHYISNTIRELWKCSTYRAKHLDARNISGEKGSKPKGGSKPKTISDLDAQRMLAYLKR